MPRFRRFAFALAASLAGCGMLGRSVPPAGTPYVAMKFCGVSFDGRTKEARFSLDLEVKRPLPAGALLEASFENPLERGKTIEVARTVKGDERELRILSTPVKGIEAREYAMSVRVYASARKGPALATYTESCRVPFAQGDVGVEYR